MGSGGAASSTISTGTCTAEKGSLEPLISCATGEAKTQIHGNKLQRRFPTMLGNADMEEMLTVDGSSLHLTAPRPMMTPLALTHMPSHAHATSGALPLARLAWNAPKDFARSLASRRCSD